MMLSDVQTSGELLLAVSPERTGELLAALQELNVPMAAITGEIVPGKAGGYISVTDNNTHFTFSFKGEQPNEYKAKHPFYH
jgi:hydrogenase maturation factor